MSAFTIPTTNNRACDCCNRRKVKCDRGQPCQSCFRAELACTYATIPRKRGPKGPAAKRIYAIKQDQLQTRETAARATLEEAGKPRNYSRSPSSDADEQVNTTDSLLLPFIPPSSSVGDVQFDPTSLFTSFLRFDHAPDIHSEIFEPHPMLARSSIDGCLELFFKNMYPIMPILHRESFAVRLANYQSEPELYALVCSLCAMTMIQLFTTPGNHSDLLSPICEALISESLRARKYCDYIGSTSTETVLTSFFLFCSYGNLEKNNHAWYYLRESISFAQSIGMDDEKSYINLDVVEGQQHRRIFWLLFITERAYALQRHRPLGLRKTISLPSPDDSRVDPTLLNNFITLAMLFQNVDHSFLDLWNEGDDSEFSDSMTLKLHQQLRSTIPPVTDAIRIQKADILVSQQWLHLLVWQLSLIKGCLSSMAPVETMRLQFPVTIAKSVLDVTSRVSVNDLEAHGIGMQEKLFDVGCALSDVIVCVPDLATISAFEVSPKDCLHELIATLANLRGGHSRYLNALIAKADGVLQLNSPSATTFQPYLMETNDDQDSSENERSRTISPSDSDNLTELLYV